MGKEVETMKSIRSWIIFLINSLVILVVVILSFFSYKEFKNALDERVLLQLTSIKRLKRIQIEAYINGEIESYINSPDKNDTNSLVAISHKVDTLCVKNLLNSSDVKALIIDLTSCALDGNVMLGVIRRPADENPEIKLINTDKIQEVLLERSGMGESGETYLVSNDYRMRSLSRFYPQQAPSEIIARTIGVVQGISGVNGHGIFDDY